MTTPLGTVCTFLNGGTPSRSVSRYFEGTIPWITGADIVGPTVVQARTLITEEAIRESPTNRVSPGTVLLVTRTSVGKVAVAGTDLCFSQDITAIQPDPDKLHTGYLVQFLRTKELHLQRLARGATIKGVTRDVVADLRIPLPPLPDQRRIADILDRADALRAQRRAAIAMLDGLTGAVFLDMFGDPVLNTMRWPWRRLSDIGSIDRGVSKHRPRNAPELLGGPYPFVQTGDVANCDGYIRTWASTYSEAGLRQSRLWPSGTLCITIAANIARTGILTCDACFPDSVVGFTATDLATTEFVRIWLSFLQRSLEARAPESAQKNINLAILRDLEIPVPSIEQQRTFATRTAAIERLKSTHRRSLASLDALFASLQHRAFRGEL